MVGGRAHDRQGYRSTNWEQSSAPIRETHSYNLFRYLLLLPFGEQSWDINLKISTSLEPPLTVVQQRASVRKTTQPVYYSFLLHHLRNQYNILNHAGLLFQEYIVHAYAQVEQSRLGYLRLNQENLRSEVYRGIVATTTKIL